MGVIGLVLLLVGGIVGVGILLTGGGGDGGSSEAVAVPEAELPQLGDATPVLASLSNDAPAPDPAVLSAQLTPLLTAAGLGSGVSAEVVDVASGDVLLDLDAADPATPSSTAKLLTAVAALTTLDPTDTIETTVVAGTTPGEVVLVGRGDLTLSRTAPSESYPGAPTVADLATQVTAALPAGTPVSRIVVDSSLFTGPLTASGWGPADAPSSYAAPVTATAVDGARVSPGSTARSGQPGLDAGAALADALGAPGATVALTDAGIDVTGVSLSDGSGLSKEDQVPASVLAAVVKGAADGSIDGASALLSGLPVAGYDGTLFDRGDAGAAPGTVRAKTGTLLAVHALAGTVVTADGRLLAFAVVADGSGNEVAAESALDDVAAELADCGCR